jgi:hypothetical protein
VKRLIKWIGDESFIFLVESGSHAYDYTENGDLQSAWSCFWRSLLGHMMMRLEFALRRVTPKEQINYDEIEIPF